MLAIIKPSHAAGHVKAPASKSAAHRLLIAAGLSQGTSHISNVTLSKDIEATLNCLKALGADWTYEDHRVTLRGGLSSMGHHSGIYPCNECGSTLRFFVPLCLLSDQPCTLTGSKKLLSRPMQVYEALCQKQGLRMEHRDNELITQGVLQSGTYEIPGDISSQFITGLLFALPLLQGDSLLKVTGVFESRPYVDMTLQALKTYGIEIQELDGQSFRIPGGQTYKACDSTVEGDWSNAAFLYALEMLNEFFEPAGETGYFIDGGFKSGLHVDGSSESGLHLDGVSENSLHVEGVSEDSLQGDKVCIPYYKALCTGAPTLDVKDCPDLAPVLFAMAGVLNGATFTGTRRLAFKESDRVQAMKEELLKMGITVTNDENTAVVTPAKELRRPDSVISGHNDHRIVMAMATILTLTGGSIEGAQAVTKSYPDYFEQIQKLGIEVTIA